jgi:glycosyltransferase involved in cell wall biosynthesis
MEKKQRRIKRIAILGTRGIPNRYGGFEQCAEKISPFFIAAGYSIDVFCERRKSDVRNWNGVKLVYIPFFAGVPGLRAFSYDLFSILAAVVRRYDVIIQLGYSPSALFYPILRLRKNKILTNMAGIEWKRKKWGTVARWIIKLSENIAVLLSTTIIADNKGIKQYLDLKYNINSKYIAYGAEPAPEIDKNVLETFGINENEYFMLVARFQPDNNIEMILDGYLSSGEKIPFIVVGGSSDNYEKHLRLKYLKEREIRFVGSIYDYKVLCSLRALACIYFHGHSAGGTNPSLLEAMASGAKIAAYENVFNRSVLGSGAIYFSTTRDVLNIINTKPRPNYVIMIAENKEKIRNYYSWDYIAKQYIELFD